MISSKMRRAIGAFGAVSLIALAAGCGKPAVTPPAKVVGDAAGATAEDAAAFVDKVEATYREAFEEASRIQWVNSTYINFDTDWLAAKNAGEITKMAVDFANEAAKFDKVELTPDLRRKLDFMKLGITLPAPTRDGAADELAQITTRLGSTYSTGSISVDAAKYKAELSAIRGPDGDLSDGVIRQNETELLMRQMRDPEKLAEVWTKWNDYAAGMKNDYARMVEIANDGAKELGYSDVGALWRSGYDMTPDEFEAETDRLWSQVKPLYDQLHCFVRAELNEKYGDDVAPLDKPIRADLLGNMWAQEWGSISDVVSVGGAGQSVDLDKILVEKGYDPVKMVSAGESFFTSLGFDALPDTFWQRSQITKPRDREVVCHASAWDLDSKDDLRIKMCTTVGAEDFTTIHHELGHNFYQRAYKDQPILFQGGANDGFHEAIGDMIALSITPEYLKQIGLIETAPPASEDLSLLMRQALDKIAFFPFGLIVDKYRWKIFAGEVTPDHYNDGWWALRTQYQGIRPPTERPGAGFDAGGKYHVPGGVPYTRYFLARILQFQFYKAACDQIGWTGPLHRCSFYGSKEVGAKFNAMMEMGASKPWPDALEAFTGTRQMDGSAIIAYFKPLMDYLEEENAGRQCGW
ncbi:MAG: M2 family metallopeptidase [Parvularculaceae bacterium]